MYGPFDDSVEDVPSNPFSDMGQGGPQTPDENEVPSYEGLGEVSTANLPAEDPISVGQINWGVDGGGSVPGNSDDVVSQDPFSDWDQVPSDVDVPIDGIGE